MEMTYNDALARYNLLTNLKLSNDSGSISTDVKMKIIRNRINLSKVKKEWDAYLQEFANALNTDRFNELYEKERTPEEETEFKQIEAELNAIINKEMLAHSESKVNAEYTKFTEDEFYEITEFNVDNNPKINGITLSAPDYLEMLYTLMV